MHVKAFGVYGKNQPNCPASKFMIEGEEEVGSENLGTFCCKKTKKVGYDIIVNFGYRQ